LALHEVMRRGYWSRLWIIQEIVMGASATWLRCGGEWVDWGTFCEGVAFLEEHLWLVKDDLIWQERRDLGLMDKAAWSVASLHLVYLDLSMLSRREQEGGEYPSFGRLLDLANSARCKQPADKVFALVGLMPPAVASRLEPDYTVPVWNVFAIVAWRFIEAYGNLEPIREGNPWGPSGTPSWAADWLWNGRVRWARPEGQLSGPSRFFARLGPNSSTYVPYQASGDGQHDAVFSVICSRLSCSGFIVDRISGLSARGMGYFAWDKASVAGSPKWRSAYGDRAATREALYRTLEMDRVARGQRASDPHACVLHLPTHFAAAEWQFEDMGWTWLAG